MLQPIKNLIKQSIVPVWDVGARHSRHAASKLVPVREGVRRLDASPSIGSDGLPVPPPKLWREMADTADDYVREGAENVEAMLRLINETPHRTLDLGCAAGRMTRAFAHRDGEHWGVDIAGSLVQWAQGHLSPPLHFVTTTTQPHLPFKDGYFDLVYGGSVFTHISDLADATLLEVRRVLRPGGLAYFTLHDEHTLRLLLAGRTNNPAFADRLRRQGHPSPDDDTWLSFRTDTADPGVDVFYRADWVRKHWGRWFDVVAYEREAFWHHSAIILKNKGG